MLLEFVNKMLFKMRVEPVGCQLKITAGSHGVKSKCGYREGRRPGRVWPPPPLGMNMFCQLLSILDVTPNQSRRFYVHNKYVRNLPAFSLRLQLRWRVNRNRRGL